MLLWIQDVTAETSAAERSALRALQKSQRGEDDVGREEGTAERMTQTGEREGKQKRITSKSMRRK